MKLSLRASALTRFGAMPAAETSVMKRGVRTGIRRGIHGMRPIAREVPHLARLIELLRSSTNVAYCASKILDELASDCVSRSTLVGDEDVDLAGPDIGELALQRRPLYVAAREPAIGICAADSVERADAELACPR